MSSKLSFIMQPPSSALQSSILYPIFLLAASASPLPGGNPLITNHTPLPAVGGSYLLDEIGRKMGRGNNDHPQISCKYFLKGYATLLRDGGLIPPISHHIHFIYNSKCHIFHLSFKVKWLFKKIIVTHIGLCVIFLFWPLNNLCCLGKIWKTAFSKKG